MKTPSPVLSIVLVPLLTVWPAMAEPAANSVEMLQVHAVDGENSANSDQPHSNQAFSVQITDQNGSPVVDAAVLARLPDSGLTGSFGDGTHAAVGYSDAIGQARFSGIQWNAEHGTVPITITATKGAAHAGTLLEHILTPDIPEPAAPQIQSPVPTTDAAPAAQAISGQHNSAQAQSAPKEKVAVAVAEPAAPSLIPTTTTSASPEPGVIAQPKAPLTDPTPETPSVSVVNGSTHEKFASPGGSSHKKWYILAAIVAGGAAAGVALMGKTSGSSSSVSTPAISIGSPSVTVGHP